MSFGHLQRLYEQLHLFCITFLLVKRSKELEEEPKEESTTEDSLPASMAIEGRPRKLCHFRGLGIRGL